MKHFLDLLLYPVRVAVTPLYIEPLITAAIIAGAATVGGTILNAVSNVFTNKKNESAQKEINSENIAFQREQFDYQKYLNENQYQMTASDMQKAGLNPMLMNGANLTSGSYQSNAQAPQAISPNIDLSAVSNIASAYMQSRTQKDIASDSNQTSKDVANINASSQEEIARQNRNVQESIAQGRLKLDENIAKAESARKDAVTRAEIERLRRGYTNHVSDNVKNESDLYDLYKKLRSGGTHVSGIYGEILRSIRDSATSLGLNPDIDNMSFEDFSKAWNELYSDKYDYSFNPHTW